jgi:hypothetical protein
MSATQGDTINVTVGDLSIQVKPLFQGPSDELAGAKISVATTGPLSVLGLPVLPLPAIEVLKAGLHITKAGDITVGVKDLLGVPLHENVHLGGTLVQTVVDDLRAVLAGTGAPLKLVTDLLAGITNGVSHTLGGVLG